MAATMRAMLFERPGRPLVAVERERPQPGAGQWLLRVRACGICRTDLHLLDGEVDVPRPPRILGHQIIGTIEADGDASAGGDAPRALDPRNPAAAEERGEPALGSRVGVPWLAWTCGRCEYCTSGCENLCPHARFTGRDVDGGMAEWTVADKRFCFPIPDGYPDEQAAPLLCAGLIGYRALRFCGDARRLGLYGFGAAAHILIQLARSQGRSVYAFARRSDDSATGFARELGAVWAGGSDELPPEPLDAAIIFAPVGELVPAALRALAPGGTVVCGGIHMSDVPTFPYEILWLERSVRSVANLTRADGNEFLRLAPRVPIRTEVRTYPLEAANDALDDLRAGRFIGAAVIVP